MTDTDLVAAFEAELARITVGPTLQARLEIGGILALESAFELRCYVAVVDRNSGKPITFGRIRMVRFGSVRDAVDRGRLPDLVSREARKVLREAMIHEIDESIRVDGELVFDPHPGAAS